MTVTALSLLSGKGKQPPPKAWSSFPLGKAKRNESQDVPEWIKGRKFIQAEIHLGKEWYTSKIINVEPPEAFLLFMRCNLPGLKIKQILKIKFKKSNIWTRLHLSINLGNYLFEFLALWCLTNTVPQSTELHILEPFCIFKTLRHRLCKWPR